MADSLKALFLPLLPILFFLLPQNVFGEQVMGAASCSSSNCHGGTSTKKNQFTIWATKDKHSKAYEVLFQKKSQVMARSLKLEHAAPEDVFCLRCHAFATPEKQRGAKFDLQDGVTCESCHGAAGRWIEPHTRKGWDHGKSLKLGMTDNQNLRVRGESCLSCHTGIDHRLLAAGHPDLVFELDTFSDVMPKHWKEATDGTGLRAWAQGQALGLEHSLEKTGERARKEGRLDLSDRNCFSCHHDLYDVSWPLDPTTQGRALWNSSRYAVFRHFLEAAFPEAAREIEKEITSIETGFGEDKTDSVKMGESAGRAAKKIHSLQEPIRTFIWTPSFIKELVSSISGDDAAYRQGGFRVAEQGLMAIDALTFSSSLPGVSQKALREKVKRLYDTLDLKDPARYDPERFADEMKRLQVLVNPVNH